MQRPSAAPRQPPPPVGPRPQPPPVAQRPQPPPATQRAPVPPVNGGGSPAKVQAGKTWSDEEEGDTGGGSCSHRSKFAIWMVVVILLVLAIVGLSVTMAVLKSKRDKNGNDGTGPTPGVPSPPGGNPDDITGGGGGSQGNGFSGKLPAPGKPSFDVPSGWDAVWWDDFDGGSLDDTKWSYDLGTGADAGLWAWGNNEMQSYQKDNVGVADGMLTITAEKQSADGMDYTSGRINTKTTAAFYPGMELQDGSTYSTVHIEANIKVPQPAQGLWPAFWAFPVVLDYGKWPASGEIDVLEMINTMTKAGQGLHYGDPYPDGTKQFFGTYQTDKLPYSDGFHIFSIDWSLGSVTFYIDGEVTKTLVSKSIDPDHGFYTTADGAGANAPFDIPNYLILNLAVGGNWPKPPNDTTPFPSSMTVDWVRVLGKP